MNVWAKAVCAVIAAIAVLSGTPAHAACSWTKLINGNIANANEVMDNFDCLAPIANPAFTGNVGISSSNGTALNIDAGSGFSIFAKGNYVSFLDPSGAKGITLTTTSSESKIFADYFSGSAANSLQLGTWPNEAAVTILSSGNVGIGTSEAANRVEIVTPPQLYGIEAIVDPFGRGIQVVTADYTYGVAGSSLAYGLGTGSGSTYGSIQAQTAGKTAAGALVFQADGGNVGIGTTNPGVALTVAGPNASIGTNSEGLRLQSASNLTNGTMILGLGTDATDNYSWIRSVKNGVGESNLVLQGTGGNVGIGTTLPAQKLDVDGAIRLSVLASGTSDYLCYSGGGPFVLASCSSSIRYKENIQKARFGLDQVLRMRPVTFKWKERKEEDFGFIAEEMARIDRRFVTYKNGKIEGVKYPQLTAVLVGAIKELKAENGRLAAKLVALQSASGEQSRELRLLKIRLDTQNTPARVMTGHIPNTNARQIKTAQN
jgi:hypothetical protein